MFGLSTGQNFVLSMNAPPPSNKRFPFKPWQNIKRINAPGVHSRNYGRSFSRKKGMATLIFTPRPCPFRFTILGALGIKVKKGSLWSCEPFGQKIAFCNIGYISVHKHMQGAVCIRVKICANFGSNGNCNVAIWDNTTFNKVDIIRFTFWNFVTKCFKYTESRKVTSV